MRPSAVIQIATRRSPLELRLLNDNLTNPVFRGVVERTTYPFDQGSLVFLAAWIDLLDLVGWH